MIGQILQNLLGSQTPEPRQTFEPHSQAHQFKKGDIIGDRFEVKSLIGWGAMGYVLHAKDLSASRDVALKFIYSFKLFNDEVAYGRFKNEFEIMKQFHHPNIVKVYDYHRIDEVTQCISMEYVDGKDLGRLISLKRLPEARILNIALQICRALKYTHELGVVHRDLKPENILILSDDTIKLTDYGISKLLSDENGYTMTGEGIGTPAYMSPEQFATSNQKVKVTNRSDIYCLGIILFELIEGKLPYICSDYAQYFIAHAVRGIPKFDRRGRSKKWYRAMVLKMLEKEPEQRQKDIEEVITTINQNNVSGNALLSYLKYSLIIIVALGLFYIL